MSNPPYIDCQLKKEVEKKIRTTNYYLEVFETAEEAKSKTILYGVAPEMLDFIIDVLKHWEKMQSEIKQSGAISPVLDEMICDARALISKAKGET